MTRVLFITLLLIGYGSLYPWTRRVPPLPTGPVRYLSHAWPAHIGANLAGDIVVNLILYMPVGMFGFLSLDHKRKKRLRWILPPLLGFVFSTCMELSQVYIASRDPSLLDVLDNTLGTIAGTILGSFLSASFPSAAVLIFYWLGSQISSLFAIVTHRRAAPSLTASPLDTLTFFVAWALTGYMIVNPIGRRTRLAIGIAIGFFALLVLRGLYPFHLKEAATPFHWAPFVAMFGAEWIYGLPVFLEKSFYYGTIIWLIRAAGLNYVQSTTIVTATLGAIEIIQRHLPNRTPEITDPLMAVILGMILWLTEQDYIHEHDHTPRMQPVR